MISMNKESWSLNLFNICLRKEKVYFILAFNTEAGRESGGYGNGKKNCHAAFLDL